MKVGKIAKDYISDKGNQSALLGKIGAFATNWSEKIGSSAISEATTGTNADAGSDSGSGVEAGPVGIDTNPQTRGEWVSNKESDKKKKTTMMLIAAAVVLMLFMFKKKK
jgi:hypothetical protein